MEGNKEEIKNVNLVIQNQEDNDDNQFSFSLNGIIKNLKRLFALWLAVTIIVSILATLIFTLTNIKVYKETSALISFTYSGIEKGQDPNGNKFDVSQVKSPLIISKTLDELGYDDKQVEIIRNGISLEGIVPQNAIDKITAYKEIIESGSNQSFAAVEKVLETTYYPTQYKVHFNYSNTVFNDNEAATFLNKMLETYSTQFLNQYGFNQALGTAVTSIDYKEYDYAEALDVFDSTLNSLKNYVDQLNKADSVRFRSSKTGLSFADISDRISTIKNVDMDIISSYITLNVITKDKDSLRTYYKYRVEDLERHEVVCRENLTSVTESINNYEKNTVQIFGAGTDSINTTAKEASAAYDSLFERKLSVQNDLSTTIQRINMYKSRLERLDSTTVGTSEQKQKTEADLMKLNESINKVLLDVSETANEYYDTVVFSKAYNILVPASASTVSFVKNAFKDSIFVVVIADALIFVLYFGYCVIESCIKENTREGKKTTKKDLSSKAKKKVSE